MMTWHPAACETSRPAKREADARSRETVKRAKRTPRGRCTHASRSKDAEQNYACAPAHLHTCTLTSAHRCIHVCVHAYMHTRLLKCTTMQVCGYTIRLYNCTTIHAYNYTAIHTYTIVQQNNYTSTQLYNLYLCMYACKHRNIDTYVQRYTYT